MEAIKTWDVLVYENVYSTLYTYGLPTICIVGFLGNVMNLLILTGRRVQHSLRAMEQSANACLIALAVADMSFCISAFPSTFLPEDMTFDGKSFLAYYGCYCAAIINIFIMTSTWLTVVMSTERYLAICHPLKSRNLISLHRTRAVIVVVYLASVLFNVPVFWRYSMDPLPPPPLPHQTPLPDILNTTTAVQYVVRPIGTEKRLDHMYRGLWSVLGNLIPLLFLVLCNVSLAREIHRSYDLRQRMNENVGRSLERHRRRSSLDQDASNRITVTLVSIVVMFFLLVAPSEIVKQIAYLIGGDISQNYTYLTIEVVTNLMQTVNFSANFILYCIVNPSFRKVMREMTSCVRRSGGHHRGHQQLHCYHNQQLQQPLRASIRRKMLLARGTSYRDMISTVAYYSTSVGGGGVGGGRGVGGGGGGVDRNKDALRILRCDLANDSHTH